MPWSKKIPAAAARHKCPRCRKNMTIVRRDTHFDADGTAMVSLRCEACRIESVHYWTWKW